MVSRERDSEVTLTLTLALTPAPLPFLTALLLPRRGCCVHINWACAFPRS